MGGADDAFVGLGVAGDVLRWGAGCGESPPVAGAPGKDLSPFVGTWAMASAGEGMTTVTCGGQSDSAAYPGMVTWVAGTSTDLVQTAAGWTTFLGCTISANVSDYILEVDDTTVVTCFENDVFELLFTR